MMVHDEAIDRIKAYARHMQWHKTRLAREAGLSDTVLRHFDAPYWNPTRRTVAALLRIIPEDFRPD